MENTSIPCLLSGGATSPNSSRLLPYRFATRRCHSRFRRGNGSGGWRTGAGVDTGSGWSRYNRVLSTGDFNGDGHPDVLGREPDGALYLSKGNGTGAWATGQRVNIGVGWQGFTRIF